MAASRATIGALGRDQREWMAQARALRAGADTVEAARAVLGFLATEGLAHLRVVAEWVLPAVVDAHPAAVGRWAVARARVDALAGRLAAAAARGAADPSTAAALGRQMARLAVTEAREVIPPALALAPAAGLALATRPPGPGALVLDAGEGEGAGAIRGYATADLNLTLVAWPPGRGVAPHTNTERDVLLLVTAGSGTLGVDGHDHRLAPGVVAVVRRGSTRQIAAGPEGLRYLSAHLRASSSAEH